MKGEVGSRKIVDKVAGVLAASRVPLNYHQVAEKLKIDPSQAATALSYLHKKSKDSPITREGRRGVVKYRSARGNPSAPYQPYPGSYSWEDADPVEPAEVIESSRLNEIIRSLQENEEKLVRALENVRANLRLIQSVRKGGRNIEVIEEQE